MNGYYDAYDYAFTMFQLDGGTKKTGSVGGTSTVTASKEQVAEGEEFTLAFQVSGAGNVNALGQIIAYDPSTAIPGERRVATPTRWTGSFSPRDKNGPCFMEAVRCGITWTASRLNGPWGMAMPW